jgi:hypothetical protein
VDTYEAANNLRQLMESNASLENLKLTRANPSENAFKTLVSDKWVQKRFKQLSQLTISYNNLNAGWAMALAFMALKGSRLEELDLSNNCRIGDEGCVDILRLLELKGQRLNVINMEDTGISPVTAAMMDSYRNRRS